MTEFKDPDIELAALNQLFDKLNYLQTRKFLKTVKQPYPRFLYKFRALNDDEDVSRLREIVVRSQLWLSSPENFNDPFDMSTKFVFESTLEEKRKRIRDALKEQGKKFHEIERELPKIMGRSEAENIAIAHETHRSMVKEIGVCSFGGDPRNILMWSHYAANHQGVCLVFEIGKDPKTFMHALKVNYSDEYPVMNWVRDFRKRITEIVLRKHEGWAYEKERRIIWMDAANTALRFRPEALRAIIMGCRVSKSTVEKLRTLLAERRNARMPAITVYECSQHESRYELKIHKAQHF